MLVKIKFANMGWAKFEKKLAIEGWNVLLRLIDKLKRSLRWRRIFQLDFNLTQVEFKLSQAQPGFGMKLKKFGLNIVHRGRAKCFNNIGTYR